MMTPLQTLKTMFVDQPDVLRMLDRRELDLQSLTDTRLVESYQTQQLYPQPVNLYVTGRTGAGKTSLGNCFLSGRPLSSTGRQDCTSLVQFFRLASNLVYLDLPGSGSDEKFENINRAAMMLPQIDDPDEGLVPVDTVPMLDFTDFVQTQRQPTLSETVAIPLVEWAADSCRRVFTADVILYVVAPHGQWLSPDRKYLRDLLKTRKAAGLPANVVFALNLFRNPDGTLKPTQINIDNVKEKIIEDWQKVYPGVPTIAEVNSLTGAGLQALASAMCQMLPPHKIGNMGDALAENLRSAASRERSRRYRALLVRLAARMATYKVDAKAGQADLLPIVFSAICDYGIEVFHEETVIRAAQRDAVADAAKNVAIGTKSDREQAIKVQVSDVEHVETTVEEATGTVKPIYEEYEESMEVPTMVEEEVRRQKSVPARAGLGIVQGILSAVASPISLGQTLFGSRTTLNDHIDSRFRNAYHYTERVMQMSTKTVTQLRQRLTGFEVQKATVTKMVPKVVLRDQEVGKEALVGGSRVILEILALGQAIETLPQDSDLAAQFEQQTTATRAALQAKLAPLMARIDALASLPDPVSSETQLLALLMPVVVE